MVGVQPGDPDQLVAGTQLVRRLLDQIAEVLRVRPPDHLGLAGVDTIADDAQQRLALQVARLNQGMRARGALVEDPVELARRFCSTGPAGSGAARMRDRFFRACEAALE